MTIAPLSTKLVVFMIIRTSDSSAVAMNNGTSIVLPLSKVTVPACVSKPPVASSPRNCTLPEEINAPDPAIGVLNDRVAPLAMVVVFPAVEKSPS